VLNVCGERLFIPPDGDARDSEARRREYENEWEAHARKADDEWERREREKEDEEEEECESPSPILVLRLTLPSTEVMRHMSQAVACPSLGQSSAPDPLSAPRSRPLLPFQPARWGTVPVARS
jgi:hypothetical protein